MLGRNTGDPSLTATTTSTAALANVGHEISETSVANILKKHGLEPKFWIVEDVEEHVIEEAEN